MVFGCTKSFELSLAILYILKLKPYDAMAHFGMCCNSFSSVNRGTSRRFACAATGFLEFASVQVANLLLERSGKHLVHVLYVCPCDPDDYTL